MKRRDFIASSTMGVAGLGAANLSLGGMTPATLAAMTREASARIATRKILIAGGGFGEGFIRYMATLTGKKRPKLLYLPTASADSPAGIVSWFKDCSKLDVEP